MSAPVVRVVLDTPLPHLARPFDYRVPEAMSGAARPGVRVTVPFGSGGRTLGGWVVPRDGEPDFDGDLALLDSIVSPVPVLTRAVWELAVAVADRQAGRPSDVLRLAIPARQVRVERSWLTTLGGEAPSGWSSTESAPSGPVTAVSAVPHAASDTAGGTPTGRWAMDLVPRLAETLADGRSAILAVPDHRDLDQALAALEAEGRGGDVVRVDARRPNAERYASFLRLLEERPAVVVGNRSALLAPAHRLGLLVVWDDGDPLHAEPLAPYPHARDVALLRRSQSDAELVFAAHSRSTEVQRLVRIGFAADGGPPAVLPRVVATGSQEERHADAARARMPSVAWTAARAGLDAGPVLVQVARPGYAAAVACSTCRTPAVCSVCAGPLRLPVAGAAPSCLWCGRIAAGWTCRECGGHGLGVVTPGSARTAEELGRAFPRTRVIVSDGDRPLLHVGPEPALVVATRGAEPSAPGGYRAVLLLDGERMLAREGLRVAEDCLRWWSNAAALAAPGAPVVLAGVRGRLATRFATWTQDRYADEELTERQPLRFPPLVRVASVRGTPAEVEATVAAVLAEAPVIDILGTVPLEDGVVRSIIRFAYRDGGAVAHALRAAVVRSSASGRRPVAGRPRARATPTLRVRLDDPEIF